MLDAGGKVQNTVARLSMSGGLPPEVKGSHTSRFVEVLEHRRAPLNVNRLLHMFDDMLLRLDAQSGEIELAFPYFISNPILTVRRSLPKASCRPLWGVEDQPVMTLTTPPSRRIRASSLQSTRTLS